MTTVDRAVLQSDKTTDAQSPSTGKSRLEVAVLVIPAAAKLILQLVFIKGYGLHLDELYFLACSEHLDWGYVDHPPLSVFLLWLERLLLGDSVIAIRLLPALAGTAIVLGTQLLARRLGAGWFGQLVAGVCALVAPLYLFVSHQMTMNAFDVLFWLLALHVTVRLLDGGKARLWIALGIVIGLGLQNKISVLFLGFALVTGILLTRQRRILLTREAWLGGLLAGLLFLPHIAWQIAHGWPTLEFIHNAQTEKMLAFSLPAFVREQTILMQPLTSPVWAVGLGLLLLHPGMRRYRPLGWSFLVLLSLFVVQGGKPYYLGPIYPLLFAAGGFAAELILRRPWWRAALVSLIALGGVLTLPLALPVLPVDTYIRYASAVPFHASNAERSEEGALPAHYTSMFGWKEMTEQVDSVYRSLPPDERARCRVVCENYAQAGAIDFYGKPLGLPRALSGHNSYWLWEKAPLATDVYIVIGRDPSDLRQVFFEVEARGVFRNKYIQPTHNNKSIWVVRKPKVPLPPLWPRLKFFI